ncbi:unnamed protein product, partial [Heligmosomoides polygyrus]|uniref:PARP catalytic domain-containing protein n=1 Tax=Heligmosomoides polygyrus TaxID=6339 RepID=A0A183GDF6_HELPZ
QCSTSDSSSTVFCPKKLERRQRSTDKSDRISFGSHVYYVEIMIGYSLQGCTTTMKWHPRMGRNRLLDHVRTHWRKKVKKCKLCDFEAIDVRKVECVPTLSSIEVIYTE